MAQITEKVLSICALRLRHTFTLVKSFSKVGRYVLRRAPNFMKSTLGGESLQRRKDSALILKKKGMVIHLLWLVVYECA